MTEIRFGTVERAVRVAAEDVLDRGGFVGRIVDALIVPTTSRSTGVVLGVVGSWGSGKSSVLNMVHADIRERHNGAIVLRFDPWLVSGRDDLIAVFLAELSAAIGVETANGKRFVGAIEALNAYGQFVTPIIELANPTLGAWVKGGLGGMARAVKPKASLSQSRAAAAKAISELGVPVVVLIDELDRVEDADVRTMAQLVRSVADFDGISYLLAYDPERVAEALGGSAGDPHGRGRSYLEKIVQLPISLPILLDSELHALLMSEVDAVHQALAISPDRLRIGEHRRLIEAIVPSLVSTPRDVKRLIGTYRVMVGMLRDEVDLADLLGFSALQVKAPRVVDRIRRNPETCVLDPLSFEEHHRRGDIARGYDPLAAILQNEDLSAGSLLLRLFPALSRQVSGEDVYPDAIGLRRGLMTALRLGALPGAATRSEVEDLLSMSRADAAERLRATYDDDAMGPLVDRLTETYGGLLAGNDVGFWQGLSNFLGDPASSRESQLVVKRDVAEQIASVLTDTVHRRPDRRPKALAIFQALSREDDLSLVPAWLHKHIFAHGLFGARNDMGRWFLSPEETNQEVLNACSRWGNALLTNTLLPRLLDGYPLYLMLAADAWMETHKAHLATHGADNVDRLATIFFGGSRIVGRETIESLCGYDRFMGWIEHRRSQSDVDPALSTVFERASRASLS